MYADIFDELGGRGLSAVIGLILGGLIAFGFGRWRRMRERHNVLSGDARDTVVIHQHIVESEELPASGGGPRVRVPRVLRLRSLGQSQLRHVVPNGHLASVLHHRATEVSSRDTLISMEGAAGSYLLETLTGFVCDRVGNAPFEHDLYVMAPCCEPAAMVQHQPVTILLISVADLALFENWSACRGVRVEHGGDGCRVLTLMELARRFKAEQEKIGHMRREGKRTQHVETMYILDLALDRRSAAVPTKAIPWGRFEAVLKQMNLE